MATSICSILAAKHARRRRLSYLGSKASGSYKIHRHVETKTVKRKSRFLARPALSLAQEAGADSGPGRVESCSKEDDGLAFRFKLPPNGLALRSVAIVDDVPEIRFDASHKVPTITEEDVAIALRLASEGIRPEFFFIPIPFGHRFYGRQFNQYKPQWLRGTSVGKLLFDADWIMKCLSIGARSNDEKSKFWGWQKTSQLEDLATRLDFPEDNPPGSIKMSCESAKVQKGENEMVFPEEPKMKIVDDSNSLYSKYISEMYPSVAYHDEPRFLKMQELIKLILAAEWLIEKGVRVSKKWMMTHTVKPRAVAKAIKGRKSNKARSPPKEMIPPQPAIVKVPSTDVSVKTREAEQYRCLAKYGVGRRYGWDDFGSNEMIMFDEKGELCLQQRSLKMVVNHHVTVEGQPTVEGSVWFGLPLSPTDSELQEAGKQLSWDSYEEVTGCVPGAKPCLPLALPQWKEAISIKASVNDYDMLYHDIDPNKPIWPEIPGICEEVTPNVKSWGELYSETVPWPHVWQVPYVGVGKPVASGGVTTCDIPVRVEPLTTKVPSMSPWVDQYMKCDSQLAVRAQCQQELTCSQNLSLSTGQADSIYTPESTTDRLKTVKTQELEQHHELKEMQELNEEGREAFQHSIKAMSTTKTPSMHKSPSDATMTDIVTPRLKTEKIQELEQHHELKEMQELNEEGREAFQHSIKAMSTTKTPSMHKSPSDATMTDIVTPRLKTEKIQELEQHHELKEMQELNEEGWEAFQHSIKAMSTTKTPSMHKSPSDATMTDIVTPRLNTQELEQLHKLKGAQEVYEEGRNTFHNGIEAMSTTTPIVPSGASEPGRASQGFKDG